MKKFNQLKMMLMVIILQLLAFPLMAQNQKVFVASDLHYFDPDLIINDGSALETYLMMDRKMIRESAAIFEAMVDTILSIHPDLVFFTGDLTKDGELNSHQKFAGYCQILEDAGIEVLVIPGNHDINNPHALAYDGANVIPVPGVSPEEFASIYQNFGFGQAVAKDPNSLTYIVEPVPGLQIFAMDVCKYDNNYMMGHPETSGAMSPESYSWISQKLQEAQAENKSVLGLMHHNLIEHYQGQKSLFPEYVIDDNATLSANLANLGMKAVFTGHFHSQDIVELTTAEGNTIYDIETGSMVTYPCPFRTVQIVNNYMVGITTGLIDNIDYEMGGLDFQTYAYNYINTGLPILVNYMLTSPPFSLDPVSAGMITPVVTEAFIAHYHGNEGNPSAQSQAVINYLLSQPAYQMFGMMIMAVWNDPQPDDWTFGFNFDKLPQPGYVSGDFHQHTTYTDGAFSFNHVMAKNNQFGLDWWANSEHGGGFNRDGKVSGTDLGQTIYWDSYTPNPIIGTVSNSGGHRNMWRWQSIRDYSFENVLSARQTYNNKMIFQAYEMNVPGHEHASMGLYNNQFDAMPNCNPLAEFEFKFDQSDNDVIGGVSQGWTKSALSGHAKAVEAVTWLQTNYPKTSYVFAAHPERKNLNNIAGFRDMNNAGPDVCYGFESMPGHQKGSDRGEYKPSNNSVGSYTFGGCGIYAAKVGGLWDAMLSEGRNWWLFASSDFHNETADFYPGEYQKTYTYVKNRLDPQAYFDGLRSGNSFVVNGDLIDSLMFQIGETPSMPVYATMGETFTTDEGSVVIKIVVRDPQGNNNNTYSAYTNPALDHVDLIMGKVTGKVAPGTPEYSVDQVSTTSVIARFDAVGGVASPNGVVSQAWTDLGNGFKEIVYTYNGLVDSVYFRLRGTNHGLNVANETDADGNPLSDGLMSPNNATKAYADLWFYSNPIFVQGPSAIFSLTILHNNDAESQLLESSYGPAYGGVANFKTVVDSLKMDAANRLSGSIMLSSGDNFLAGPEFSASLNLPADQPYYDAVAMDHIGYDAVCMGNHDFDFGPDVLEKFIRDYTLTQPAYLGANLDFSFEPGMQDLVNSGRIRKSTVLEVNGQQIGIVGLITPLLSYISSPRNVIVNNQLVTIAQHEVDSMMNLGINKIILISHLQSLKEDSALISQLRNVDIAIAGGGDELLTNDPSIALPGMDIYGSYPLQIADADGKTVYVVTTPGEYTYVGHLMAEFDIDGNVVSIDPASNPVLVTNTSPDATLEVLVEEPVSEYVANLAQNIIATTQVTLDGVKNNVRTIETNEGDLVADATLWQAKQLAPAFGVNLPDVAFQNGGGIRNNAFINAGSNITELTTFDILPFANFVAIVENVSPSQFKEVLENAVSRVEFVDGRFAQIAGFEFTWDPAGTRQIITDGVVTTPGTRVIEAKLANGTMIIANGSVVAGAPAINIATIDFLAKGGDQYPLTNLDFTTLGVTYQQALYNYITYITSSKAAVITATDYPEGGNARILNLNQQNIYTPKGWSIISGYIEPYNSDIKEVLKKITTPGNLEIMISMNGFYWPSQNINTFTSGWSSQSGYKIKMNVGDNFILNGIRTEDKIIDLAKGVNYLPVPSTSPVAADAVFSQIANELIFAFDIASGAVYWPDGGLFTLNQLVPGNAYLVRMSAAASVDFTGFKSFPLQKDVNLYQQISSSPFKTELTGNYHLIAILNETMSDFEQGDVITIFKDNNTFAGQVLVEKNGKNTCIMAVGDDATTETTEGFVNGETMNFKLYRPSTEEIFDLYPEFSNTLPNAGLFAENGASMIVKFQATSVNTITAAGSFSVYPNPNTGTFNVMVKGFDEIINLEVFNAQGQLIRQNPINSQIQGAECKIDLSTSPKGIYFVKANSLSNNWSQKVIVK